MKYVIDTNIVIDHLRGDPAATHFLEEVERGTHQATISVITEFELLAFPHLTPAVQRHIMALLALLPKLSVTSSVARTAASFHRRYQTDMADALIAATALRAHATLVTRNLKHFRPIREIHTVGL